MSGVFRAGRKNSAGSPPWHDEPAPVAVRASTGQRIALLAAHPVTCDAVADLLGCAGSWEAVPGGVALLSRHPETAVAVEALLAI